MEGARRKRVVINAPTSDSFSCRTCRSRRVKCDGGHPVCKRCLRDARVCKGYNIWTIDIDHDDGPSVLLAREQELNVRLRSSADAIQSEVQISQSTIPPILRRNRPYIDHESRSALSRLLSYGVIHMTQQSPLPHMTAACFDGAISLIDEPMFGHALAALAVGESSPSYLVFASSEQATVHAANVPVTHANLQLSVDRSQLCTAIRHYCEALKHSRRYITDHNHTPDALGRILLIGFLLFLFEIYQGNETGAKRHRRLCISIAKDHWDTGQRSYLDPTISSARALLASGLPPGELSPLLALPVPHSIGSLAQAESELMYFDHGQLSQLCHFDSWQEAGVYLEILVNDGRLIEQDLLSRVERASKASSWSSTPAKQQTVMHCLSRLAPVDSGMQQRLDQVVRSHDRWKQAFDSSTRGRPLTLVELLFEIVYFVSCFSLMTARVTREQLIDEFIPMFERTLGLIETYLLRSSGYGPQNFSTQHHVGIFEFGIIQALFFIGLKCRSRSVRRKAVRIMDEARRVERENNSLFLASIARAVIALEEQRAQDLFGRGIDWNEALEIPEAARFNVAVMSQADIYGMLSIVCGRFKHESDQKLELLHYRVGTSRTNESERSGNELESVALSYVADPILYDMFELDPISVL